jgi:hypothetical protein
MKKEILIAVVLGLIFGGIIVFGFYQSQRKIASDSPLNIKRFEPEATESATATLARLVINAPYDGEIFGSDVATVSGTTSPNSYVVIVGDVDDLITQADDLGYFSAELELQAGQNDLNIYNYDESGQTDKKQLSVVFSTEFKNE